MGRRRRKIKTYWAESAPAGGGGARGKSNPKHLAMNRRNCNAHEALTVVCSNILATSSQRSSESIACPTPSRSSYGPHMSRGRSRDTTDRPMDSACSIKPEIVSILKILFRGYGAHTHTRTQRFGGPELEWTFPDKFDETRARKFIHVFADCLLR